LQQTGFLYGSPNPTFAQTVPEKFQEIFAGTNKRRFRYKIMRSKTRKFAAGFFNFPFKKFKKHHR